MAENTPYIPTHLLIPILKRLPSKALIRFLTVSKSWHSLITSPDFISSHLQHHKSLPSTLLNPPQKFLPNPPPDFYVVSTCYNGLICLFNSKQRKPLLFNPSINKFLHIVPPPKLHVSSFHAFVVLGFGYNPLNHDYKLVLIDFDHMFIWGDGIPPDYRPYAQVYSVNGGLSLGWKRVLFPDNFPLYDLSHISESCFVNNLIHWIVFRGGIDYMNDNGPGIMEFGASILTFDPRDDCFWEMQLPQELNQAIDPELCLATIGDSLVVVHLSGGEELGSSYSAIIWKMEDYGVKDSWNVLYRIKLPSLYGMNPNIWEKEDGKVLITTSMGTLIVFNVKSGSSSVFDGEVFGEHGYTESLVLLDKVCKASWLQ
ncbi:F-box protein CPR1 [Bienertia sinuspersici]